MDELAIACELDPIELRIRNEPAVDPESGRPFSSRNLVACLREGAQRFGWQPRDPTPRLRRDGTLAHRDRRRRLDLSGLPDSRERARAGRSGGALSCAHRRRRYRDRRLDSADPDRGGCAGGAARTRAARDRR